MATLKVDFRDCRRVVLMVVEHKIAAAKESLMMQSILPLSDWRFRLRQICAFRFTLISKNIFSNFENLLGVFHDMMRIR